MNSILLIILAVLFSMAYLWLAQRLQIVDVPNQRSSHHHSTIRGAGLIYVPVILISIPLFGSAQWILISALSIGGLTGFVDDLVDLKRRYRLLLYALAVGMAVWATGLFEQQIHWYLGALAFVITLGTVNTYNFMDGINGISLLYALVLCTGLYFFQEQLGLEVVEWSLLLSIALVTIILAFLNVRSRAKLFIGDAGSIFLGIFSAYVVLALINQSEDPVFLLMLSVYGVDSVGTILLRLLRKENIFSPHRLHIYQMMANERAMGHIKVSIVYALFQLAINALVLWNLEVQWFSGASLLFLVLFLLIIIYIWLRIKVIGDFQLTRSNA